jgi:CO/xanthine dehydrogenase Mo-binding subunit
VANAIKDATGVRLTSLPLQGKALWQKLQEA